MADYLNNFSLEGKVALITGASYGDRLCDRKGNGRCWRNDRI